MDYTAVRKEQGAGDTAGGLLELWGASAMLDGEDYLRYPLFKV